MNALSFSTQKKSKKKAARDFVSLVGEAAAAEEEKERHENKSVSFVFFFFLRVGDRGFFLSAFEIAICRRSGLFLYTYVRAGFPSAFLKGKTRLIVEFLSDKIPGIFPLLGEEVAARKFGKTWWVQIRLKFLLYVCKKETFLVSSYALFSLV